MLTLAIAAFKTSHTRPVHKSQELRRKCNADSTRVVGKNVAKAERRPQPINNQLHRERSR